MLQNLYYLNKLRRYLGIPDALAAFIALRVKKDGIIKLGFLKYPFRIRVDNIADSATFNEVLLRKEYAIGLDFIPKTIIDGGANIGLTSLFFANKYPGARIVAVEPDGGNFDLLRENTANYSAIKPMRSAIWSHNAHLKIYDPGRGDNSYRVEETTQNDPAAFTAVGIADIMRQQNWSTIDILKLDVEGAEKVLFTTGYGAWLPRTRVLIVETHDRYIKGTSKAVFAAISKYNFSCRLQGYNLVLYNEDLN
jgi:FkbM family methyltransferase